MTYVLDPIAAVDMCRTQAKPVLWELDRRERRAYFARLKHALDCHACVSADGDMPSEQACPTVHALMADEIEAHALGESIYWLLGWRAAVDQGWLDRLDEWLAEESSC